MKPTILYVEDDLEIGEWTNQFLKDKGYEVDWRKSGENALHEAGSYSLVILDVMLPGLDGFTVGQRLKKNAPHIPVLMLSARSSIDDKLQGLNFADDYLTKPFHPDELAARIEILLRRYEKEEEECIPLHHIHMYPKHNRIVDSRTNEELTLTGKQFHIFRYMIQNANQILTKEQIYEGVWGDPYIEGDKTLQVHIRYLREKIELDPSKPLIIETIRGIGYRVRR
ncbi:response regulator transcription factor [Paenibacillus arenosi]|uniref:Response regulator transcription factor n=1 Tax=Paenibacillus arenosi TaxID=2774142 RepID=A0ABR9B0H6_9BACL|nr:response regulator transcription factor [Paenibacillus arenosi]MBD8499384.1 response regulator transcription factor [Paenibacillus arenosi]